MCSVGLWVCLGLGAAASNPPVTSSILVEGPEDEPKIEAVHVEEMPEKTLATTDYASCLVCHGAAARGNRAVGAPSLIRWPDWYVREQFERFRNGWRGEHDLDVDGNTMAAVAKMMNASEIEGAVRAIQGWRKAHRRSEPRDDVSSVLSEGVAGAFQEATVGGQRESPPYGAEKEGEVLFSAQCLSCHGGPKDDGRKALKAPPLHGVAAWYLRVQLAKYASGQRGYHPSDDLGRAMAGIAKALGPKDIDRLVAYLSRSGAASQ